MTNQDSIKEDFKSWRCRRGLLLPDSVYSAHYLYCEDVVVDIEMRTCVNCARIQGFVNSVMVFYLWIRGLETEHKKSLACGIIIRAILLCFEYSAEGYTKEEPFSFISFPFFLFPWHKLCFCRFRKKKKLRAAPSNAVPNSAKCFCRSCC